NLTKELWEEINNLYLFIFETIKNGKWDNSDPRGFFTKVKKGCQILWGINESTISRSDGWHFGQVGQSLERADNTSRILDVKYHILLPSVESVGTPIDIIHWTALLKSVSAYNMYRRRYGRILPINITEFLILEKDFPRSILFCLQKADLSLRKISGNHSTGYANQAEKKIGSLRSDLEFADINDIFAGGLHEYLDDFQKRISEISTDIYNTYFNHIQNKT
ncbi:MAG: alpha-E domain-containing protein, partial [Cyclobacteriaceae bacterium]|nr:alpha-E domain-containing protein [Cyclobacteriaceae bacterium]